MAKLLLVTGQRLREVANLQKGEIDADQALWLIPAHRTKSDREHAVPLSSLAFEILAGLPEAADDNGTYLFSTRAGHVPVSGFSKAKRRMDKLSGVTDWHLHDLRRTLRSGLPALGVAEVVGEKILNHDRRDKLQKIYNRYEYLNEKRDALARWAQRLREIIEPPPENVVPLREAQ